MAFGQSGDSGFSLWKCEPQRNILMDLEIQEQSKM